MKQTRRISTLLLAMAMLCSLALTGCGKKEAPAPADQVAVGIFEMILKDDASKMVELLGYADEAEAREDMGLNGSIYDELAEQLTSTFTAQGANVTTEQMQEFVNAFMKMFSEVELTAKVKESDEKAGTAVVTCTINTFDSGALETALGQVMTDIMADEALINGGDEDALYSAILNKMSEAIAGLTPTENTTDFDVDFVLEEHTINGKNCKVWLPKDAEAFGAAISSNAMGA